MKISFTCIFLIFFASTWAQVLPPRQDIPVQAGEQLENLAERAEDSEPEDDSWMQEMNTYLKHPLNINEADESLLQLFKILTPIQIRNFLNYRSQLGNFVSVYELQAIPGWDVQTIQKIRPYLYAGAAQTNLQLLRSRFKDGDHSILLRASQVLEKSKGYTPSATSNYYLGSPQKLFVRYKYNFKNQMQFGVLGEKDAGEQFFKDKQNKGFDFYSAHFYAKNLGSIKALALGDFSVNLGQGLTQWMSMAFGKGPDVLNIKRQAPVLRPYNSAGEIFFFRGAGITVGKKNWEATVFASYKKTDANFINDTLITTDDYVSSLQTSGYHRTKSESEDKNTQSIISAGGNFKYKFRSFDAGVNVVHHALKLPLIKDPEPYNMFGFTGKNMTNYSVDFGFTRKNMHVFGEAAMDANYHPAVVAGAMVSVSSKADVSFLYRNISYKYNALYGNAFTESTYPTNEKGLYTGISIKPVYQWKIDAYLDFFSFPWLRYRVNKPGSGNEYFLQVTYKPNKQFEFYSRFRSQTKSINNSQAPEPLHPVFDAQQQNWRTQFSYKLDEAFTVRSRAEYVWYDKKGPARSVGSSIYADVFYKPLMKPFSAGVRLQYFETDDYNSRVYTFENDVQYYYSIPVFSGKGFRTYLNLNYDVGKKISFWLKLARTVYPESSSIGSGLDFIPKNHKSEIRFQSILRF